MENQNKPKKVRLMVVGSDPSDSAHFHDVEANLAQYLQHYIRIKPGVFLIDAQAGHPGVHNVTMLCCDQDIPLIIFDLEKLPVEVLKFPKVEGWLAERGYASKKLKG